ncbi:hypothetical protein C7424_3939 [Pantoea ananatis]|nr:hypothetical protein C7424_3939 [Pantoea ananatis]
MLAAACESAKDPAMGQHQSQEHFRHLLMMVKTECYQSSKS